MAGGDARFAVTPEGPRESRAARWGRRVVSISTVVTALVVLAGTAPAALVVAALLDLVRRSRGALVRLYLVVLALLVLEVLGIAAAAWLWLRGRRGPRYLEDNFRLQCWWAGRLFDVGRALLGMRVVAEGLEQVTPGPILLLCRHASMGDALLPAALVSRPSGLHLRTVMKKELTWDPCLDIVGHRLPNTFVRRASADPAREVALVGALAAGLGPGEGLLLFPEGTRFSPDRRARALARLQAEGETELARVAEGFVHVLPPRLGGLRAALAAAPDADVVFLAHTGLEGARRLSDLWRGALVGGTLRIAAWRCARAEVPADPAAAAVWLFAEWRRLDAWVASSRA